MKKQLRTLLKEDLYEYGKYESVYIALVPKLLILNEQFSKLDIGVLNNEIWKMHIEKGIVAIETLYKSTLEVDLNKLGVSNKILRANILNGANELFDSYKLAYNEFLDFANSPSMQVRFPLELIEFIDEIPQLTDKNRELIKETFCRTYINGDFEHTLFEKLNVLKNAFNDLLPFFDQVGFKEYFVVENLNQLLYQDNETKEMIVNNDSVHYITNYRKDYEFSHWIFRCIVRHDSATKYATDSRA